MPLIALPAVFMRGGTSRAVMFRVEDLPERGRWDALFLAAMGSPDPNGRQLDGMGGGVSSLSKICVLGPPSRPDADVDYTFAQVQIREAAVDYKSNCGNMSSAVGPYAVDEGLVTAAGDTARVRIHNTNTGKIIRATFPLQDGRAATDGDLAIPGVAGSGAAVRLEFLTPGGATTGRLLPTGKAQDRLNVPDVGLIAASMIDAANACVFVRATDLGLTGTELPDALEADQNVMERLAAVRIAASVAMGIAPDAAAARAIGGVPFVGFIAPPMSAVLLDGTRIKAAEVDLTVRFLSNGQPHRALPLTASLCTAVAARIAGTVVADCVGGSGPDSPIRLGMPSGVLTLGAEVGRDANGDWVAHSGAFWRTARRLFDGRIYLRA